MRIHKTSLFLCMSLLLTALGGCKEQVPPSNTPAYYALHGIVNDGKTVNEITLFNQRNDNHPKLRFPAGVFVSVDTRGAHDPTPVPIRKGYATNAESYLDLTEALKLKPVPYGNGSNTVRITFNASLDSEKGRWKENRLNEIIKSSARTTDRPEWKLREYIQLTPNSSDRMIEYDYVAMDKLFRQIDGGRIWIGCQASGSLKTDSVLNGCASFFDYPNGLSVTYHYNEKLLSLWREVYEEVLKFTDSVLVK